MPRHEKFETFIKKAYQESSMEKRKSIREDYEEIEDKVNDYYEKKINAKDLSSALGSATLGFQGQHASAQIYAYENLIKAIAETKDDKDIDTIAEEVFYDAAAEDNPMKKSYLLGILNYYSNLERMKELYDKEAEEKGKGNKTANQKLIEEKDIIQKIRQAARRIKKEGKISTQEEKIVDYVLNNFPRDDKECEAARLISNYYSKEDHATRMPALGRRKLLEDEEIWEELKGSGVPRYVYVLPEGWHPSGEKLDEADRFGLKLIPQAAYFEGNVKFFVEYDMNPELAKLYNRRIRYYKDKGDFQRAEDLERAFRERVWREIEKDPEAKQIFQSPDNIVLLKKTIRDWPVDVDAKNLLEKDFRETPV